MEILTLRQGLFILPLVEEISLDDVLLVESIKLHNKKTLLQREQEYLLSGAWKCSLSPTGAHYWVFGKMKFKRDIFANTGICKYCQKEKISVTKAV